MRSWHWHIETAAAARSHFIHKSQIVLSAPLRLHGSSSSTLSRAHRARRTAQYSRTQQIDQESTRGGGTRHARARQRSEHMGNRKPALPPRTLVTDSETHVVRLSSFLRLSARVYVMCLRSTLVHSIPFCIFVSNVRALMCTIRAQTRVCVVFMMRTPTTLGCSAAHVSKRWNDINAKCSQDRTRGRRRACVNVCTARQRLVFYGRGDATWLTRVYAHRLWILYI